MSLVFDDMSAEEFHGPNTQGPVERWEWIGTIQDMAQAALASGTHRLEINGAGTHARLVEREEPDPDVLYKQKGKEQGPFIVFPTPFTTPAGHEIDIIALRKHESEFGFSIVVNVPDEANNPVYVPFDPRK